MSKDWKKAYFYFVPIYFNESTDEWSGRNWLCEMLLQMMIGFHHLSVFVSSLFLPPDFEFTYPVKIEDCEDE